MKICSQCILPDTFPGISFDDRGVCSQCQKYEKKQTRIEDERAKLRQRFLGLLDQVAPAAPAGSRGGGRRSHDLLMAYSGGKDSTYTLSLFRKVYGLRVLAVSFDNGFLSPAAVRNIRAVTDSLGVDHVTFRPRWDLLRKIFIAATEHELYSKKTLERASTLCTSCIGLVKSVCLKMAVEQNIPLLGFGWSPGQAPLESAIMKNNPSLVRIAQKAILDPLREIAGEEIAAYFLGEQHYASPERFPYNVHPMAWEPYNEGMILQDIRQYGWSAPSDTDSNSTNCLLNAYANDLHLQRYRFHPYVWEIANMVREGFMTREEGHDKIYGEPDQAQISAARERLMM